MPARRHQHSYTVLAGGFIMNPQLALNITPCQAAGRYVVVTKAFFKKIKLRSSVER
jgi:hypothetical protein